LNYHLHLCRVLQRGLKPIKARFGKLLEYGKSEILGTERVDDSKARALCRNLSDLWDGLWTFSKIEGVEPTPTRRGSREGVSQILGTEETCGVVAQGKLREPE